jgi:hypothetical protein
VLSVFQHCNKPHGEELLKTPGEEGPPPRSDDRCARLDVLGRVCG